VHNEPDFDLTTTIGVSNGHDVDNPAFFALGFAAADADTVVLIEPQNAATATIGNTERFWSYSISAADNVGAFLPPSPAWCWFLKVDEAGYVNRSGRITAFSVFVHDTPGSVTGTLYTTDAILPEPTIETQISLVWIPEPAISAPVIGAAASTRLTAWPNPFTDRSTIRYSIGNEIGRSGAPVTLGLYDVAGRVVRMLAEGTRPAGEVQLSWDGRDQGGAIVPPGVYFLLLDAGSETRSTKLVRVR
jgi:hypothetical protein